MNNDYDYDNEIIDTSDDNETSTIQSESTNFSEEQVVTKKKKKKNRRSFKEIWMRISRKKRILILVFLILIVLIIIGLILYFVLFNEDEEIEENTPEEVVVIENDNYRYENGSLVFLDSKDNELGTYECTIKDSDLCYVTINDLSEDAFDRVKNVYESGIEVEENTDIYYDRYVFINDDATIYLYDMENKQILLEVDSVKVYDTEADLVVISNNGLYSLIEITESGVNYLIREKYDYLGIVNTEEVLLVATEGDTNYIINASNKKLSEGISDTIKSVSDTYIAAFKNNSYYLYTYDYDEVASDYDFISFHDNLIALVDGKKIYLIDDELNKLHEETIKLNDTNYITKYIYDDDNTLIETKAGYSITVNGSSAFITSGTTTTEINIYEGVVSASLDYVSYYNGKLYFYSDIDKVDVAGTYTCTNKNTISSASDTLTNCYVYKTSDGYSGIYNSEYVFIYDNMSNSSSNYYLYDFTTSKVKGTYNSIEIVNSNEINSTISPIYTSSSYIVARSATGTNKGNYGVIEISSSSVSGKVSFAYSSITKSNGYYLFINVDGTYTVYDTDFSKISNEFAYIKLYDNYYVGVNNNKLNIYSYYSTVGILESDLAISSNDFTVDFTDGFTITTGGNTYKYTKNGVAEKEDTSASEEEEVTNEE